MPPQSKELVATMSSGYTAAEREYGPYPSAVPVPFTSKEGATPPEGEISKAKHYKR